METAAVGDVNHEQRLNAILLTLVKALEQGQALERKDVLAAHPEFAAELEEFFAGRDFLNRLAVGTPAGSTVSRPANDLGSLGDFQLLREIGRGGMGIWCLEAQQISLDRHVALKVLPFTVSLDGRQLQRFKNEAHAAALLNHPHIVPIYSVGCDQGVHYYAMQMIQGHSLAAMIFDLRQPVDGKMPTTPETQAFSAQQPVVTGAIPTANVTPTAETPKRGSGAAIATKAGVSTAPSTSKSDYFRRVARLGVEAAEGLEHAHQLGVIHRDIKPANLLVDVRGNLWITDFGVALLKNNDAMTKTGELVGTLRYMSPEQAGAERGLIDQRTDIYSLGATLYELITLEPAFASNDTAHLLGQITSEEPRQPRTLDSSIPTDLEIIVLKAMAKYPGERYASAQELADDLGRFLHDQPIRATRPKLVDRAVKWSRRHKSLVIAAIVMLVLTTIASLIATLLISQSQRAATTAYENEKIKSKEAEEQRERAEKNLARARQVVAFLTQVSADEMRDTPEFWPVRHKLLSRALQYYQEFIEEHQDDPAIRSELDASSNKVKQILSVLTAQQDYLRLMLRTILLGDEAIQRELAISAPQRDRLWNLGHQFRDQRNEAFRNADKLTDQERSRKFRDLAAASEKVLATILTTDQAKRLKQIALQQQGVTAFADPHIAEALRLTAEQQASIAAYLDEAHRSVKLAVQPERGPKEADDIAWQIAKETNKKIVGLLDTDQKKQWREMTGPQFAGRLHFLARGGFGLDFNPRPPPPLDERHGPKKGPPRREGDRKDGPPGDGRIEGKKKKNF